MFAAALGAGLRATAGQQEVAARLAERFGSPVARSFRRACCDLKIVFSLFKNAKSPDKLTLAIGGVYTAEDQPLQCRVRLEHVLRARRRPHQSVY